MEPESSIFKEFVSASVQHVLVDCEVRWEMGSCATCVKFRTGKTTARNTFPKHGVKSCSWTTDVEAYNPTSGTATHSHLMTESNPRACTVIICYLILHCVPMGFLGIWSYVIREDPNIHTHGSLNTSASLAQPDPISNHSQQQINTNKQRFKWKDSPAKNTTTKPTSN